MAEGSHQKATEKLHAKLPEYERGWQDAHHAWQKALDEQMPDWDQRLDLTKLPRLSR